MHFPATGELAKGWQQTDVFIDQEARQAQALSRLAAQYRNRVHMSGQHAKAGTGDRLVLQGKGPQQQGLVHYLDSQPGRWIARMPVVIAASQQDP